MSVRDERMLAPDWESKSLHQRPHYDVIFGLEAIFQAKSGEYY